MDSPLGSDYRKERARLDLDIAGHRFVLAGNTRPGINNHPDRINNDRHPGKTTARMSYYKMAKGLVDHKRFAKEV